jgi:succinate dehydrogenase/fumarate reductase flavoprotein subunit
VNLEKIKETPVENLSKEDKVALVLVLLKQLQPYLSSQNLSTAMPLAKSTPKNIGGAYPIRLSNDKFASNAADQVLHAHGASGTASDVDALNSILNNINVQTKN